MGVGCTKTSSVEVKVDTESPPKTPPGMQSVKWTFYNQRGTTMVSRNRTYSRFLDKVASTLDVPPVSLKLLYQSDLTPVQLADHILDKVEIVLRSRNALDR